MLIVVDFVDRTFNVSERYSWGHERISLNICNACLLNLTKSLFDIFKNVLCCHKWVVSFTYHRAQ